MTASLLTALVLGLGLTAVVVGLQRNHARATGINTSLSGSVTAEDRDIARIRAELDAAGSERAADPPAPLGRRLPRAVRVGVH